MKTLKLFLIGLLLTVTVNAQVTGIYKTTINNKGYSFGYTTCLKPQLDDFFNHPLIKSVDLQPLNNYEGIFHINITRYTNLGSFGATFAPPSPRKVFTIINEKVYHYLPTFIEALVYHEMYHVLLFNEGHCQDIKCPYILHEGNNINIETVIKTFNKEAKTEYFMYIIDLQTKNKYKKGKL